VRNKSIYQVEAFQFGFSISHPKDRKRLGRLTRNWLDGRFAEPPTQSRIGTQVQLIATKLNRGGKSGE